MPAVLFTVRWPDGAIETCYSPSTIIREFFEVGRPYPLADFLARSRKGLEAASDRVRERFGGSGCSHALAQLATIEAAAKRHSDETATVRIEGFQPQA